MNDEERVEEYQRYVAEVKKKLLEAIDKRSIEMEFTFNKKWTSIMFMLGTGTYPFSLSVNDIDKKSGYGSFFLNHNMNYEQVLTLRQTIDDALKEHDEHIELWKDKP